ncbi:MAG: isochorismate synthase [Opitutales bacterium]|nr:isochorismate synthase [Opitutales bacterium]
MEVIETTRHHRPERSDLLRFLGACRDAAAEDGHWKVASISLRVRHIDPLAVLETIYEPGEHHAYLESPSAGRAIAGADAVVLGEWTGGDRFERARAFADEVLEHTVAVGDVGEPMGGPHFLGAFTFLDDPGADSPFPGATVFLPRWQVAQSGGAYVAVANCRIDAGSDIEAVVDRIWAAHGRFSSFAYDIPVLRAAGTVCLERKEVVSCRRGVCGFRERVEEALQRIEAGEYEKIVLARALDLRFSAPLRPLETADCLRNRFPSCHIFSYANGCGQSLIGATPERLAETDGRRLRTEAIAGSAARGSGAMEDARLAGRLLHSEKDRREHEHVVASIRRRLAQVGLRWDGAGAEPRLLDLPNVRHLHTPIEVDLPETVDLLSVAAALHPTSAVGGTPRDRAVADIVDLEPFPRGLYAGLVGWFNHRRAGEWVVAIRSALVEGSGARLFAGAGIVRGSDPDREFAETEVKMRALLDAITEENSV